MLDEAWRKQAFHAPAHFLAGGAHVLPRLGRYNIVNWVVVGFLFGGHNNAPLFNTNTLIIGVCREPSQALMESYRQLQMGRRLRRLPICNLRIYSFYG